MIKRKEELAQRDFEVCDRHVYRIRVYKTLSPCSL